MEGKNIKGLFNVSKFRFENEKVEMWVNLGSSINTEYSFQTCTQGFIESLFVLPYTFPKAFLTLRYKYRMSILRFFYLFFHEIIVNIRNTVNDIKGHIISKLKGQKVMKAQEFGELLMKNIEENINWTQDWHLCKGNLENDFAIAPLEDIKDKELNKGSE